MKTHSPAETRRLGAQLSRLLQPGDVLCLYGDLGAGKSELTRGLAKALGIEGPIASPSFTILNVYEDGRLPLYHFDWYRLRDEEELYEMGMDEFLGSDGVAVIEWPARCPGALPDTRLDILITPGETEDERSLTFSPHGAFRPFREEDLTDETAGD